VSFGERKPYLIERLVVSLTYLSMGMIGFIWLVLGALTRTASTNFVKYHVFQSIFISIALFLLNYLLGIITEILSVIPFIKAIVAQIYYLLNVPIVINYSIIQLTLYAFIIYAMTTSALGKYTYIPFVSDIIAENFGHRR